MNKWEYAIGEIHSHFYWLSWPIDPSIYKLRAHLYRKPICDFPKNNPLDGEIHSDDIVIEAGANLGGLTRYLSRYAKQVYSFEPSPKAFGFLRKNVADLDNVKIQNLGLSDKSGIRKMFVEWSFSGANSYIGLDLIRYPNTIDARFISVDELNVNPTILIFDLEGAEVDALNGSIDSLKTVKKIFCETHRVAGRNGEEAWHTYFPVLEFLRAHGYRVSRDRDRGDVLWLIGKRN